MKIEYDAGRRAHEEHRRCKGHGFFDVHVDSITRVRNRGIHLAPAPTRTELEIKLPCEYQGRLV
jgi:hypothetical protein